MMGLRTNVTWALMAGLLLASVAASPASAQTEGIQVHGEWVIEVRNADGTLASRTEFRNALAGGGNLLVRLLARVRSMGGWSVELEGPTCVGTNGVYGPSAYTSCDITDWRGGGLTVAVDGNALRLSGTTTVRDGSSITEVKTAYLSCGFNQTAANGDCADAPKLLPEGTFTRRNLPSPIAVSAGQIVQVTVRISFS